MISIARRPVRPLRDRRCASTVTLRKGEVCVTSQRIFGADSGDLWTTFVERLFAVPEVRSVEINRARSTATIRYAPLASGMRATLERIASSIQDAPAAKAASDVRRTCRHVSAEDSINVFRYGAAVSTWEIVHNLPGRMRLRHPRIRGSAQRARELENELSTVLGVTDSRANPVTGGILVRYNPAVLSSEQLLHVLEGALYQLEPPPSDQETKSGLALAHWSLALAVVGEFLFPAAVPFSAALLVGSNLKTIARAASQLRQRTLGAPVLYTAVITATLATGNFTAAALMSVMVKSWRRQYERRLTTAKRRLLAAYVQRSHVAWLERDGAEIETAIDQLRPGDVVIARAGEAVPADGRIIEGKALIAENHLHGDEALSTKNAGDSVLATSLVYEGSLRIEVVRTGAETLAAGVGRLIDAAVSSSHVAAAKRGEAFAGHAAAPVLATAGVGLLVGGAGTAAAILRPDYETGPGMAGSLRVVHDVSACLHAGMIIRSAEVFRRITEVDVVLFEHTPTLPMASAAEVIRELRLRRRLEVGLCSEAPDGEVWPIAEALDVDFHDSELTPQARVELIGSLRQQGHRVAYIGNCAAYPEAARAAHVSISLIPDITDGDPADVILLRPEPQCLSMLWELARQHVRELATHYGYTVVPNLLCIVGAFFFGFTSLSSVIITNLGTLGVYSSCTNTLRRLELKYRRRPPTPKIAAAARVAEKFDTSQVDNYPGP